MSRILFAIKHGFKEKKRLKQILNEPSMSASTLIEIKDEQLHAFKAIVLDFDGVMASHGAPYPEKEVEQWLHQLIARLSQSEICILSNKPLSIRQQYFAKNFPGVRFINAPRKKPYPDGLLNVAEQVKCHPSEVVLVDDRLLTGCLATLLSGTKAILITKPYRRFCRRPFSEAWFSILRFVEKRLV